MWNERNLTLDDLRDCRALSNDAGWNQNDDDWRFILTNGYGRGLADEHGVFASAAIVPYKHRIAWICMVLVAEDRRGRGHASQLMRWATDLASHSGLIAGLDATPAGRAVYQRMGFRDVYTLTRWESPPYGEPFRSDRAPPGVQSLLTADLPEVISFDRPRFGADRGALLGSLRSRLPECAFVARRNGEVTGFAMARPGCRATQVGPVVAEDEDTAMDLFARCLMAVSGPVFCDVPDNHTHLNAFLGERRMTAQRPFTRMLREQSDPLDRPSEIFALTGPEFG